MVYLEGHGLDEVGQQFGVTSERIRQLAQKMLYRFRDRNELAKYFNGSEFEIIEREVVRQAYEMLNACAPKRYKDVQLKRHTEARQWLVSRGLPC